MCQLACSRVNNEREVGERREWARGDSLLFMALFLLQRYMLSPWLLAFSDLYKKMA